MTTKSIGIGKDYATAVLWEDFVDDDQTGGTLDNPHIGQIYGLAASSSDCNFASFNTTATNTLTLEAAPGESFAEDAGAPTNPLIYDETIGAIAKRNDGGGAGPGFTFNQDHVTLRNLSFKRNRQYGASVIRIVANSGSDILLENLIVYNANTDGGVFDLDSGDMTLKNCVGLGYADGGSDSVNIFRLDSSGTITLYNCGAYCLDSTQAVRHAFRRRYGTALLYNCVSHNFGTADEWDRITSGGSDYNASEDSSAYGSTTTVDCVDADFVAIATDFRAVAGGNLDGAGDTISGAAPTTDIYGQTRANPPWIGPHEVVTVAATMPADAGAYAITGSAAGLEVGRGFAADAGAVAVTGSAAGLGLGRAVTAETGAVAITGSAAGLGLGRAVTAETGAVAVTGSAAGLGQGYAITAYTGGSIITVADAGLALGYSFAADAGAFAVIGSAAGLGVNHTISAGVGSIAVTGSAATLTTAGAFSLTADAGAVAVTGSAATLTKTTAYSMTANAGAVAVTGSAAGLMIDYAVAADAGAIAVTGSAAGLGVDYTITAESGAIAVTGSAATLTTAGALSLTADAGAVAVTGSAATLTKTTAYSMTANAGAVAVTGSVVGLAAGFGITADVGSYTITGADGSLEFYRKVQAGEGVFAITGADANLVSSLVPDIVAIIAGDQIINRYLAEPQTVNRTLSEAQNLT